MTLDTQTVDTLDLGAVYRDARTRLAPLVLALDDAKALPVAACPGWSVHDVISHLVAVVEDVAAGRLTGPPSDDQTAEQVSRRRDRATTEVVEEWNATAAGFEQILTAVRVWPGALDVLSHEQDIRTAAGVPGARDTEGICVGAEWLVSSLAPPVPLVVDMDGTEYASGPEGGDPLRLTTSPFELFRFRLGRRSRAQMAAMAWSADPAPVLDHLAVFGPAVDDLVE